MTYSIPPLPLLPGTLWTGVVASVRVLDMGRIHVQKLSVLDKNTWNLVVPIIIKYVTSKGLVMLIFRWLFFLINRRYTYSCVTVVSRMYYLILAVDLWVSSAHHQVNAIVNPLLYSSTLLCFHHAASHGFHAIHLFGPYDILLSQNL